MWQITASLRRRCYLWTRFLLESDGKEALWGDIREIRLEQVGQESGKGFSMEGIDLTFGLGRKYAIVGGKREIRHRQAAHPIWAGRHRPYPGQRAGAFGARQGERHAREPGVLPADLSLQRHDFQQCGPVPGLYQRAGGGGPGEGRHLRYRP